MRGYLLQKKRNAIIKFPIVTRKIHVQKINYLPPKNFRTDTEQHLARIFVYARGMEKL